jgi:hypothetical protein
MSKKLKYAVGDRVKPTRFIANGLTEYEGEGIIEELISSTGRIYDYYVNFGAGRARFPIRENEITAVKPELPFPVGTRVYVNEHGSNIGTASGSYVGAGTVVEIGHSPKLYRVVQFDNDKSSSYKASIFCFIEHISPLPDKPKLKAKAGDTVRILTNQFVGFSSGDFTTIESVDTEGSRPYYYTYKVVEKGTTPLLDDEFELVTDEEREKYEAEERGKLLMEAYYAAQEARDAATAAMQAIEDALPEAFVKGD